MLKGLFIVETFCGSKQNQKYPFTKQKSTVTLCFLKTIMMTAKRYSLTMQLIFLNRYQAKNRLAEISLIEDHATSLGLQVVRGKVNAYDSSNRAIVKINNERHAIGPSFLLRPITTADTYMAEPHNNY